MRKKPKLLKRIIAYIRWFLYAVLYAGVFTLLSYIMYFIAYPLRKPLRKMRASRNLITRLLAIPLWIFLDDGDDYGEMEPGWFEVNGDLSTPWKAFITSYKWAVMRNPAWNMYEFIKPKQGDGELIYKKGEVTRNGEVLPPSDMAGIVWEDGNGNWVGNKGECVSIRHSRIGKMIYWYNITGTTYWRYSHFKEIKKNGWIVFYKTLLSVSNIFNWKKIKSIWNSSLLLTELHLGTTKKRYTIRWKIKTGYYCS